MIEALPQPLQRALSPYTGIVRSLEECLALPTEPPLFRFVSEVGSGAEVLGARLDHLSGMGGAGLTPGEAAAAAVGEALERYSATFVPRARLVVSSARALGETAVAPQRFALFSSAQYATPGFPFVPFTAETRVPWVAGVSLPDGGPAWLPAELVFLGDVESAGAARIGYATSSGMACAETFAQAAVRGLCEVLERDAFMIAWANRVSLPLLDWRDDRQLLELERRYFAPTGLQYAAVDLSVFHELPTVLGVVRAPRGFPGALGVGAGTAATVERAVWKALSEAFASRSAGAKLALLRPDADYSTGERVVSFEDHIAYYADHDRAAAADFLDASAARRNVADVPHLPGGPAAEQLNCLCERVEAAGSSAYAVDVTSPDVRSLGLSVTKIVAPELCPLDVPHAARFLGGRRRYEATSELGLQPAGQELNPDPHPFP